jgi:hypothetical protein
MAGVPEGAKPMQTRRTFEKVVLGSIAAARSPGAQPGGVRLGVQSRSFRDRNLDALLDALDYCRQAIA